jgi:[acyl-carrier-protein] S-malonyltransferase
MSFALVFSGQGTQHPAMLPWLEDDDTVRAMSERLKVTDWRAAMAEPGWAERNAHAQVLLTGLALAAWQQIAPHVPRPAAAAGYSVGELAAFCAAGVFDTATALELATARALAMDRCAAVRPGGLLAVSGLPRDQVERLCGSLDLELAIRNGPAAFVLGGSHAAVEAAEREVAGLGGRSTRLAIAVASHTRSMAEAARAFELELSRHAVCRPGVPLLANTSQPVRDAASAARALAAQIAATVHWDECMDGLQARRPACVLEIGPGQALARLWNERFPSVPARSCDEFRSLEGVVRWLSGHSVPEP